MKLTLFTLALLATIVAAQKAEGDFIRMSLVAGNIYDQLRIITEPRADYSAEADKPSIWLGTGCESAEADVWVDTPVDDPSKCCEREYLNNFKIWEEEQGVTLDAEIYADHFHSDAFDGKCVANTTDDKVPQLIPTGKTYNSYMVQAYKMDQVQEIFEYLIEFHNQDVKALIYTNGAYMDWSKRKWDKKDANGNKLQNNLDVADGVFALGGENTYSEVRSSKWRGTELGQANSEWFKINCDTRPVCLGTESADIVLAVDGDENEVCEMCRAVGWGDPHIVTFDGVQYDVHVKGELTFLKSLNSGFEIQGRTEAVENHGGRPAVTTAVVVKEDNLPKIQVSLATQDAATAENVVTINNCPVQLFVDDAARVITSGSGTLDATVQVSGNRIVVEYPESRLRLDMTVRSWKDTCHFSVNYVLGDCRCDETLVGILGNPNGEWVDDWMKHDGTPVDIPSSKRERRFKKGYEYSKTWCVTAETSNFSYETDSDFDTFDECSDDYVEGLEKIVDNAHEDIKEQCTVDGEVDIGCVIDGVALGTEAANLYLDVVKNANTAPITESPTSGPTSARTGKSLESSGSQGDPHFRTWKNEHYEYHGQCDMILAKDAEFANGLGLEVQIRTKLVRFWSYIKSAAIRIGSDIIEIEGSADSSDFDLHYWINLEYRGKVGTLGGFPLTIKKPKATSHKTIIEIDLSSKYPGQMIEVSAWKEFVRVDFKNGSEASYGNTIGMLGDFKTGKTLSRDGVTVMDDFWALGNEWQVLPTDDMLFHSVEQPQFPKKCIEPEDPRGERRRRLEESSITEEQAEKACGGIKHPLDRKDCVYDILATQDLDMTGAY